MRWCVLPLLLGIAVPAMADDDHDRALEALVQGEVLPLSNVLPEIERRYRARLIEAEFEREDGRFIYEFELITQDGRIIEVAVDAATGEILDDGVEYDDDRRSED